MQNFFYRKKIQLQFSKSEVFWEKKIKIPKGSRPFFWLEPLVLHVLCRSRVHLIWLEPLVLHVLCRSRVHQSLSTWTTSLARSVPKPCAPEPLERERGRGGEREREATGWRRERGREKGEGEGWRECRSRVYAQLRRPSPNHRAKRGNEWVPYLPTSRSKNVPQIFWNFAHN